MSPLSGYNGAGRPGVHQQTSCRSPPAVLQWIMSLIMRHTFCPWHFIHHIHFSGYVCDHEMNRREERLPPPLLAQLWILWWPYFPPLLESRRGARTENNYESILWILYRRGGGRRKLIQIESIHRKHIEWSHGGEMYIIHLIRSHPDRPAANDRYRSEAKQYLRPRGRKVIQTNLVSTFRVELSRTW